MGDERGVAAADLADAGAVANHERLLVAVRDETSVDVVGIHAARAEDERGHPLDVFLERGLAGRSGTVPGDGAIEEEVADRLQLLRGRRLQLTPAAAGDG